MNKKITTLLSCALILFGINVSAGDAKAGKAKSATCTACHGADGTSTNDLWPSLKGQKKWLSGKAIKGFQIWRSQ